MNTHTAALERPAILLRVLGILKKDFVFTAAFILAVGSSFISMPKVSYIDFKVILSLFNLMVVIGAFEELKVLDKIAVSMVNRCKSKRTISIVLTFLCFFTAMLITNDVALITFVPLTLIISRKTGISMLETIILQTLAANIGSSLTPMGNPQNLYIFSFYNLRTYQFFITIIIVIVIGALWLYLLNLRLKNRVIEFKLDRVDLRSNRDLMMWIILFLFILLSIFRIVDYRVASAVTIVTSVYKNKRLIFKIDYLLLITFICFFIFIGNISNIDSLNDYLRLHLNNSNATFLTSIALSQFISNVPCSVLLSHFTDKWHALLLGVNIGGSGTLIASLASVISYKLFVKDNGGRGREYLSRFTLYNIVTLVILVVIGELLLL